MNMIGFLWKQPSSAFGLARGQFLSARVSCEMWFARADAHPCWRSQSVWAHC